MHLCGERITAESRKKGFASQHRQLLCRSALAAFDCSSMGPEDLYEGVEACRTTHDASIPLTTPSAVNSVVTKLLTSPILSVSA